MAYQIVDEPRPSTFSHIACAPFYVTLATMLGGAWLGWTWFLLNSFAIGSFSKTKEMLLICTGLVGSVILSLAIVACAERGIVTTVVAKYLMLIVVAWKLGVTYRLELLQGPSFELHEHFGGLTKNGLIVVLLGAFARSHVLGALHHWLAQVVLG